MHSDFRMCFNSCNILICISFNLFKFFSVIILIFFIIRIHDYLDFLLQGLFRPILMSLDVQGFTVY